MTSVENPITTSPMAPTPRHIGVPAGPVGAGTTVSPYPSCVDVGQDWAAQRDRAVAAHAADLARREAVEAAQAAGMLREFVAAARERGLAPVPLKARSYRGRSRYRTKLRGWYLTADERMAVAEDGQLYVLRVHGSLTARLTGVDLTPATPRLVLGEGGRDGERIPLRTVLDRILER